MTSPRTQLSQRRKIIIKDGYQVLRYEKYKSKDLYNLGIEMDSNSRKGTGNYEFERTKFNVEYVGLSETNFYQEVKTNLKERKIHYSNKGNTNLVNGAIISSGIEFFEALGMKTKDSGRVFQSGEKKGQKIMIPDIESPDDIPMQVTYFFDCCMEYLKAEVGEENIVLAQVHYDEDTPHLQAYFLPVVNEVQRKCYKRDNEGNLIKELKINKKGEKKYYPIVMKDENGKEMKETERGIFLNHDQFWKNRGGQLSFTTQQDQFNEFITAKGFNLDRGNIGADVQHQNKMEWQINELKAEAEELQAENEFTRTEIENNKNALIKATQNVDKEIFNPKPNKVLDKILSYNTKDVESLIDYAKNIDQINIIQSSEITSKDNQIKKLETENDSFRNNKELKKRNEIIKNQEQTIESQNKEIEKFKLIANSLANELNKWKSKLKKIINKIIGKFLSSDEEYSKFADDYAKEQKPHHFKNNSNDMER